MLIQKYTYSSEHLSTFWPPAIDMSLLTTQPRIPQQTAGKLIKTVTIIVNS